MSHWERTGLPVLDQGLLELQFPVNWRVAAQTALT